MDKQADASVGKSDGTSGEDKVARQANAVKRLSRGYYVLMGVATGVIIIVIATLSTFQYLTERSRALKDTEVKLLERSVALEQPLRQLSIQVSRMGQWATDYINSYEHLQRIPRLRTVLEKFSKDDSYDLDRLEPPFNRRDTGNLLGLGSLNSGDRKLNLELDMALDLFRLQGLVGEMTAGVFRTYYLSARHFMSVFPWVPRSTLLNECNGDSRIFFETMYENPGWQRSLPDANPDKQPRWTGPNPDIIGEKRVLTYNVPLYNGDLFLGIVSGELTIGFVESLVDSIDIGPGALFLTAADGTVLVSKPSDYKPAARDQSTEDLLPSDIKKKLANLPANHRDPQFNQAGIFVRGLEAAPWFLIYVQPESAVITTVFPDFAVFIIIALFLTAFLIVGQAYITRHFVRPALSMAAYVETETRQGSAQVPDVPAEWEPWFRSVAAALRLKDVERHLRSFMESARGFVVYQLGVDALHPGRSRVLFVSPSIEEIMGVTDPYNFEAWFVNIDASDRERVLAAARSAFSNSQPFDETMKIFREDRNEWAWIHAAATPVFDVNGQRNYFNGLIIDISRRKRAEEDLQRELIKFRVLYQVATAMTAERTLEENLVLIVSKTRQLLGGDSAYVALRDDQAGVVTMHTCSGIGTDAFKNLRIPIGEGLGGKVAQSGKGIIVRDYFKEIDPLLHDVVKAEGLISGIAVPIQIGSQNLGVLYAFNRTPTVFTQEDLETLTLLGNLAAMEISRKTFEKELQAARDDLEAKVEYRTAQLLDANRRLTREIRERVEAQNSMEASEQMLRTVFNISRDPIFIHDVEGQILDVNDRLLQIYEVTREQALSLSIQHDYSSEENPIGLLPALWAETLSGKNQFFEWKARRPNDGSVFDVEVFLTKLTTREGDFILTNVHDVSERKRSEEELKFQRSYSDMLFDQSPDAIAVMDMNDCIEKVNRAFTTLFGYSLSEVQGKRLNDLVVPEDRLEEAEAVSRAAAAGELIDVEVVRKRKDGSLIDASIVGSRVTFGDRKQSLIAIYRDNTERNRMLTALKQSEGLYRNLVEVMPYGIIENDKQGNMVFVNRSMMRMFGYSQGEFAAMSVIDLLASEEERTNFLAYAAEVFEKEPPPSSWFAKCRTKDGAIIDVQVDWNYRRNVDGSIKGFVTVLTDITERTRADRELRASEEKYRLVVENAAEGIAVIQDNKIKLVNPPLEQMAGFSAQDIYNMQAIEFVHPEDRERAQMYQGNLHRGVPRPSPLVFRLAAKDGSYHWIQVKGVPVVWEGKPAGLNFFTDVTEARKMEDELVKMEKLESIGVLAGGIAHDFNNLLTAIMGNISMVRMALDREDPSGQRLSEAEKACQRARDLTQQLLAFSKGGAPVKETLNLENLIRDTCEFSLRGSPCMLALDFSGATWAVQADRGQLTQVVTNMCINAVQAMPHGGTITISVKNKEVREGDLPGLEPGSYVEMSIQDQGHGIDAEDMAKIFDPYFTTKPTGSGLGLATSYAVVRNHGGIITVESKPGEGALFRIYLPATTEQPFEAEEERLSSSAAQGRVLIMDDEESIRSLLCDLLAMLGYEPAASKDGTECLEIYAAALQSGARFDLVILDLTIPGGMGGEETMRGLLEIDPEVTAIVSSGYADAPIMSNYKDYGFSGVIKKPYDVPELCAVIEKVLAKPACVAN